MRLAKRRARRLNHLMTYLVDPASAPVRPSSDSDSEDEARPPREPTPPYLLAPPPPGLSYRTVHLQHVARRTINLMYDNAEIQRRVEEFKKDTNALVISMLADPENRRRYDLYMGRQKPTACPTSTCQTSTCQTPACQTSTCQASTCQTTTCQTPTSTDTVATDVAGLVNVDTNVEHDSQLRDR